MKAKNIIKMFCITLLAFAVYAMFSGFFSSSPESESPEVVARRILSTVSKQSKDDVGNLSSMFRYVDECKGELEKTSGAESWQNIQAEIKQDGKDYIIPLIEEYATAVRQHQKGGMEAPKNDVKNSWQMKLAAKVFPSLYAEETPEKMLARHFRCAISSLRQLNALLDAEEGEKPNEEQQMLLSVTKDAGYNGYYFTVIPEGVIANPCDYSKSAIYTVIFVDSDYGLYKKDMKGLDLKAIPANPSEEGWIETE